VTVTTQTDGFICRDWQGDDGKFIADRAGRAGDDSLTLSWVNMAGDTRELFPDWGLYPWECGGGEWGFTTETEAPVADLRTCTEAWCVEAWFRVGDNQIEIDRYGRQFDFGHICGSFDSSEEGVWELFLSTHGSADGAYPENSRAFPTRTTFRQDELSLPRHAKD
jgi:hypothetical protein